MGAHPGSGGKSPSSSRFQGSGWPNATAMRSHDLAKLAVAIERDLDRHRQPIVDHTPTEEAATLATA
jgi:hypothetical protein